MNPGKLWNACDKSIMHRKMLIWYDDWNVYVNTQDKTSRSHWPQIYAEQRLSRCTGTLTVVPYPVLYFARTFSPVPIVWMAEILLECKWKITYTGNLLWRMNRQNIITLINQFSFLQLFYNIFIFAFILGSYHFLPGGWAVCLWGGDQNIFGWSKGGQVFVIRVFWGSKRGGPNFFLKRFLRLRSIFSQGQRGGTRMFCRKQKGGPEFFTYAKGGGIRKNCWPAITSSEKGLIIDAIIFLLPLILF